MVENPADHHQECTTYPRDGVIIGFAFVATTAFSLGVLVGGVIV